MSGAAKPAQSALAAAAPAPPPAKWRSLRRDRRGMALTEFAFVAPTFLLLLMATFDQGYAIYIQTVLKGAVQDGARQASIENTLWTDIEARVNQQVRNVIPSSDPNTEIAFRFENEADSSYNDIRVGENFVDRERAPFTLNGTYDGDEAFTDSNGNGIWDTGEPFTDRSRGVTNEAYDPDECFADRDGDRIWDRDIGIANSRGSGQDVISIRATLTYRRIFPFWKMIGQSQDQTLQALTYLRNQPFSAQNARVGTQVCPT